ncbi:MAG: hypothetical protein Kow0020_03110 [Wenzhouxiangellaceae bacterium]
MRRWLIYVILLIGVSGSALGLIALRHESRTLFIELERGARESDRLQEEWSRLQIELAWMGEAGRIEQQAAERLNMHAPEQVGVLVAEHD